MLNSLLAALNDCVWAFDTDSQKYLFISPSIHAITDYHVKDFQQNTALWDEIIDQRDRDGVLTVNHKNDTEEWVELTYRIITKGDKIKWIRQKKRFLTDEQTGHQVLLSVIDDVSDQKQIGQDMTQSTEVEKEIKKASDRLNSFIESITDAFFIVNKDWRFIKVNRAFEKMASKNRDEMLGSVMWDIFPCIVATSFEDAYRKAMTEEISIQLIEHFKSANKWFSATAYPSSEGLTVVVRDITHEKHVQEEITWTKNNLEALINNTEDLTWSINREGKYVYMNSAYRKKLMDIVSVEPQEGDDAYAHSGLTENISGEWRSYYQRALSGERYVTRHESHDPVTKEPAYFEVSFNPIYKNSKHEIIGVGCFARDITERLKTEEALIEQNERLRNIASLSSHELRRPVANMIGLLNIMDRKNFCNPENERIMNHMITVTQEIDEVIRLIVNKTFIDTRFPL